MLTHLPPGLPTTNGIARCSFAAMSKIADSPSIPLSEYAARRDKVLKALKGAAAVVFAGEGGPPLLGRWRPDFHFLYLTGLESEPGAAIVFDPTATHRDRQIVLLLRPLNPEAERWD